MAQPSIFRVSNGMRSQMFEVPEDRLAEFEEELAGKGLRAEAGEVGFAADPEERRPKKFFVPAGRGKAFEDEAKANNWLWLRPGYVPDPGKLEGGVLGSLARAGGAVGDLQGRVVDGTAAAMVETPGVLRSIGDGSALEQLAAVAFAAVVAGYSDVSIDCSGLIEDWGTADISLFVSNMLTDAV